MAQCWRGVGMNVRHQPPSMPYPVTSLHALGCPAEPDAVLAVIQDALRAEWTIWRTRGFSEVRRRWLTRGPADRAPLVVRLGTGTLERGTIEGAFAGLREDGALLLDTPEGRRAVVGGGRTVLRPAARQGQNDCMLKLRVIPCLDVKDGRVVKGVNFVSLRDRR